MEGIIEIGDIGNYYGGLAIKKDGEKFFWGVENWDGYNWEEIPGDLYLTLLSYEEERKK